MIGEGGGQGMAAWRQNSRIVVVDVGPVISRCVEQDRSVPVDGITCAAVPVPPTQP